MAIASYVDIGDASASVRTVCLVRLYKQRPIEITHLNSENVRELSTQEGGWLLLSFSPAGEFLLVAFG